MIVIGFNLAAISGYMLLNGLTISDFPAVNLSNEYSFNEKMKFLRENDREVQILAIGSSMALNNLCSKEIVDHFNNTNFINAASWGMSMRNNFRLLRVLGNIYKPEILIMSSNIIDFQMGNNKIKFQYIKQYIKSDNLNAALIYAKTMNLGYFADTYKYAKFVRNAKNNYKYLGYDRYGAVNIEPENFQIRKDRWVDDFMQHTVLQEQYQYLDSIADYCRTNNIKMIFLKSPYRQGLHCSLTEQEYGKIRFHISKVKKIVQSSGHLFINSDSKLWADSLFIDAMHFNKVGAELYTKYCMSKIPEGFITAGQE